MLQLLVKLTQSMMAERLMFINELQATVLEVRRPRTKCSFNLVPCDPLCVAKCCWGGHNPAAAGASRGMHGL